MDFCCCIEKPIFVNNTTLHFTLILQAFPTFFYIFMSYLSENIPENWNFFDCVKSKMNEKSFANYQHLFDSIRSDLNHFDNELAVLWKKNWKVS